MVECREREMYILQYSELLASNHNVLTVSSSDGSSAKLVAGDPGRRAE